MTRTRRLALHERVSMRERLSGSSSESSAMMKKTEAHGTEAQAARAAKSKLGETSSALAKAERALAGEQRKVAELQLLQEQATSKSLEYTQKIGTLEPKLAEATKATEAAQAEAKRLAAELRDEKSNHQIMKDRKSEKHTKENEHSKNGVIGKVKSKNQNLPKLPKPPLIGTAQVYDKSPKTKRAKRGEPVEIQRKPTEITA